MSESSSYFEKFKGLDRETLSEYLMEAVKANDLSTVKYLLSSPELEVHADIHFSVDGAIRMACRKGHTEMVKYLMSSPDLKEYADITTNDYYGLRVVCQHGHLGILKFLLTSPELKEKIDVHVSDDMIFKTVCFANQTEILQYLIFDFNIAQTPTIGKTIHDMPKLYQTSGIIDNSEQIKNMFAVRNLSQKLEKELPSDSNKNKKVKI